MKSSHYFAISAGKIKRKTPGIIGGTGPKLTIVYYRSSLTDFREQRSDGRAPSVLINSFVRFWYLVTTIGALVQTFVGHFNYLQKQGFIVAIN
jgi:hypothetical protein